MNPALVLFIHGLGGNGPSTWLNFPKLIADDPQLGSQFDTSFFEYPTSLFWRRLLKPFSPIPKVQELANALDTEIRVKHSRYPKIYLVCHSLGGVVARRMIYRRWQEKIDPTIPPELSGIILFATPNTGATMAKIASLIPFQHRQLRQLCKEADLLEELNLGWTTAKLQHSINALFVVGLEDAIVTPASAGPYWARVETIAKKDHRGIAKPVDNQDMAFLLLRDFLLAKPRPSKGRSAVEKADSLRLAGQHEAARREFENALVLCRTSGDSLCEADAYRGLGHIENSLGRHNEARKYYRRSIQMYEEQGKMTTDVGSAYCGLAVVENHEGYYDQARSLFGRALAAYGPADLPGKVSALVQFGHLEVNCGRYGEALQRYSEALQSCERIGETNGRELAERYRAHAIRGKADLQGILRRYGDASILYEEALAIYKRVGDQGGEANVLQGKGDLAAAFGQLHEAGRNYASAQKLYQAAGDKHGEALIHLSLGRLKLRQKDRVGARREFESARVIYDQVEDKLGIAYCELYVGELEMECERDVEAMKSLQRALTAFDVVGEKRGKALTYLALSRLERQCGPEQAVNYCNWARAAFEELGDKAGVADSVVACARISAAGEITQAAIGDALNTYKELGLTVEVTRVEDWLRSKTAG